MPYIAKKKANFDRPYSIGETIPDAVVDPRRADSLIAMGRIVYVQEQSGEDKPQEGIQEPAGAAGEPDGVNAPGAAENGAGEEAGTAEPKKTGKAKK